jgi:hypothetical protein
MTNEGRFMDISANFMLLRCFRLWTVSYDFKTFDFKTYLITSTASVLQIDLTGYNYLFTIFKAVYFYFIA